MKRDHNKLEELAICVCNVYGINKYMMFNKADFNSSEAKYVFFYLCKYYRISNDNYLSFFSDIIITTFYRFYFVIIDKIPYNKRLRCRIREVCEKYDTNGLNYYLTPVKDPNYKNSCRITGEMAYPVKDPAEKRKAINRFHAIVRKKLNG